MSDLVALLRQLIQAELDRRLPSHLGVVEAVRPHSSDADNENYGCDVRLQGLDAALQGVPIISDHLGTAAPPRKGDVVLITFVGGDPDQPVVTGRLYSDRLRPPAYADGQIVTRLPPDAAETDRVEVSLQGGRNGSRSWTLRLPSDVAVTVTDQRVEVTAGSMTLTIDAEAGEAAIRTSGSAVVVKDGGDVRIDGNGNLTLSAKGNLEITAGGNLKLNATGTAELKGAVVNLN